MIPGLLPTEVRPPGLAAFPASRARPGEERQAREARTNLIGQLFHVRGRGPSPPETLTTAQGRASAEATGPLAASVYLHRRLRMKSLFLQICPSGLVRTKGVSVPPSLARAYLGPSAHASKWGQCSGEPRSTHGGMQRLPG